MAVQHGQVLRLLTSLMGGLLGGAAQGIATGFGGLGTGVASRVLGGAAPGTVSEYPKFSAPFNYRVNWVDSDVPSFNAGYKESPIPSYMRMQTLDEHNAALNKYIRAGMNPMQRKAAIEKGKEDERKLKSFWSDDDHPRDGASQPSSTAVSDVHINPDGTLSVRFRQKGKWYTYRGGATPYEAAMSAHDLVTANSIGQAINKNKGWWSVGERHKLW